MIFKQKIQQLNNSIREADIRSLAIAIFIAVIFFLGYYLLGSHLLEIMGIINIILIAFLLTVIMLMAGFIVLRSFAVVGAELSLLIFLAQSYCDVPNRSPAGNAALSSLLVLSLIFIIVAFFRSLWKITEERYEPIKNDQSKEKIIFITFFLVCAGLILWEAYLVVNPIILNLCVYKP